MAKSRTLEDWEKDILDHVVFEWCSNCGNEVGLIWDVKENGYQAICPYCGEILMLCDVCTHQTDEYNDSHCDWNGETGCCMKWQTYGDKHPLEWGGAFAKPIDTKGNKFDIVYIQPVQLDDDTYYEAWHTEIDYDFLDWVDYKKLNEFLGIQNINYHPATIREHIEYFLSMLDFYTWDNFSPHWFTMRKDKEYVMYGCVPIVDKATLVNYLKEIHVPEYLYKED